MVYARPVPTWVRQSAVAVADFRWLAHRRFVLSGVDDYLGQRAEAMAASVSWVWAGAAPAPITGRIDQGPPREVAVAELWAAMAVYDGGGTLERQLRGVCADLGVAYRRPDFERLTIDHGQGCYEALSWLIGYADGYAGGRSCPLELPRRTPDGELVDDGRSRELMVQIEEVCRRSAA